MPITYKLIKYPSVFSMNFRGHFRLVDSNRSSPKSEKILFSKNINSATKADFCQLNLPVLDNRLTFRANFSPVYNAMSIQDLVLPKGFISYVLESKDGFLLRLLLR